MNHLLIPIFFAALAVRLSGAEIHEAVQSGDSKTVLKLIAQDPNAITHKDKAGNLPLHLAASKGDVTLINALLKAGAQVNARGFDDMTPLHYAAKANSEEACRLLLENGADRNALNGLSQPPAKLARAWVAHVIQSFIPKFSGAGELFDAIAAKDITRVKSLISANPPLLNAQNDRGLTALLLAAQKNDLALMQLLLEAGADVNARDRDKRSALSSACDNANVDAVRLLLRFKIKPAHEAEFNELLNQCVVYASWSGFKAIFDRFPAIVESMKSAAKTPLVESTPPGQLPEIPPPVTIDFPAMQQPFDAASTSSPSRNLKDWFSGTSRPEAITQINLPPEMRPRHLEIIRLLVESGVDVNHSTPDGSALAFATLSDNTDAVQTLLKLGARVDLPHMKAPQPLAWAVMAERPDNLHVLLEAGADPLCQSGDGPSALAMACKLGRYQMVEKLLAAIQDHSRLASSAEPLKAAVLAGHAAIVRLLLAAGVPVNIRGQHDVTPLHDAVRQDSVEVVQVLLETGAEVNAKDKAGYTPLHNATETNKHQHIPLLIQKGARLDATTVENFTPAMIAANWDGVALNLLLKAGARIDGVANTGLNALHIAASTGCHETIPILVKAGLPVNSRSRVSNSTALAVAAAGRPGRELGMATRPAVLNGMSLDKPRMRPDSDYLITVEKLLAAGADVSATDKEGNQPLHLAVSSDQLPVVRLLLAKGAKVDALNAKELTVLHIAAAAASPAMIEFLLAQGADVNAVQINQPSKYTPLMWAVDGGKVDNLKLLLQHGADPKCRVFGKKATALHMAAMHGHVETAKVLLLAGLPIDPQGSDEMTPLMVAVQAGHRGMCEWLIQNGADVNARARNGAGPLAIAAHMQNHSIAQLLRQQGAK
jgi:ankyrin repeat protein